MTDATTSSPSHAARADSSDGSGSDAGDGSPARPPSARDGAPLELDIIDSTGRMAGDDMAWLDDMVRRAASELRAAGDVRVRVIADAEMAEAHERWSGVAGTTDVLTFDLRDDTSGPLDVDALVCLDEAERRGAEREHEPRAELLLYALHAILHCMGHDDHTDTAYAAMHAREDEVLEAIGVGPLFESRQVDTRPFDQRGGAS